MCLSLQSILCLFLGLIIPFQCHGINTTNINASELVEFPEPFEYDNEYENSQDIVDYDQGLSFQNERTMMNPYEQLFSDAKAARDSYLLSKDHLNKHENGFQTFLLWLKYNIINKDPNRYQLIMDILRNRIYVRYALENFDRKLFLQLMNTLTLRHKAKYDWQEIWDQWTKYDRKSCSHAEESDDSRRSSFDSFISDNVRKNARDPLGILLK